MGFVIFIILLCAFLYFKFKLFIPRGLTIYFGVPGSGKTTCIAYFKKQFDKSKRKKLGHNFYCNVPIIGAYEINPTEDFGNYLIDDGVVCVDESGIEFNNRSFKTLKKQTIVFSKYYRQYGIGSFCLFSQGLDTDITFMRLANRVGVVSKSIIPYFVKVRYAIKSFKLDDDGQWFDGYKWQLFGTKLFFAPQCWSLFETHNPPPLPRKQFKVYSSTKRDFTNVNKG